MRYLFSRRIPPLTRVLLVESGSREILNQLIPLLRRVHGNAMELDVVTCYAGVPGGVDGRVYRVTDYSGPEGRQRLYRELALRHYTHCGIICSAEPIMTKWKWMLAVRLRSKLFIINENADFFWVDRGHWRNIVQFMLFRAGMTGVSAIPAFARLVFFPVTLAYLLLFAVTVHVRRRMRTL